jgi:hypothetical protein
MGLLFFTSKGCTKLDIKQHIILSTLLLFFDLKQISLHLI